MRIVVRGYYGAGNFGDDILSLVAYRSVTESAPRVPVTVESLGGEYLADVLGPSAVLSPVGSLRPDDVNVLGGGGLFYDFAGGRPALQPLEWLLERVGASAAGAVYSFARRARPAGERRWGRHNIAYGIGIGPYAPGSRNRLLAAIILSHFQGIAVRDASSLAILRSWHLAGRARQFTDIAFLRRFWYPGAPPAHGIARRRIAVVVRDWKHPPVGNSYIAPLSRAITVLQRRGMDVTLVSFDAKADSRVLDEFPGSIERLVWSPGAMGMQAFADALAAHDLVVSARAHGAILGAALGVPAICVGIEPKLAAVAGMLSGSARLWNAPFSDAELAKLVTELTESPSLRQDLEGDVARNAALAEEGLRWLGEQLMAVAAA